jgi:GNAT superfamily N-acetyltransferase
MTAPGFDDSGTVDLPVDFTVRFTGDPATFLAAAEEHLALDPVLTTVVSSVTHRALEDVERGLPAPEHPRWWAVVRDGSGAVSGVAMRTAPFAPYPLFVLPMPEGAALALARALHARGEEVRGVNGALPAARVVADAIARLDGGAASVHEHTRLFELGDLVEPAAVPGRLRPAAELEAPLALRWFDSFEADAAEQAGRADKGAGGYLSEHEMRARIAAGRIWFWEDETGEPVHLTGFNPPSFGVARVGPVYTPPSHRGRGIASAAVAEVSRRLLADGARVCLFTDQANPTSNKIYQAIGFAPVADMANLVVTPSPDQAGPPADPALDSGGDD